MATEADEFADFANQVLGQPQEEDFSAFAVQALQQQAGRQLDPITGGLAGVGGQPGVPGGGIVTGGGGVPVQEGQVSPVAQGLGFGLERAAAGFEGFLRAFPSAIPGVDVSTDFHEARRERDRQVADRISQLPPDQQRQFETGRVISELAPDVLAPGKSLAQRIFGSVLLESARPIEGDDPSLLSNERQFQAATGLAFSGVSESIVKLGKKAIGLGRKALAEIGVGEAGRELVEREALEGIDPALATKASKLAEEFGTFVSPGEAVQRELTQITEGNLPLTREVQDEIQARLTQREQVVSQAIRRGIQDIVPEGDDALAKKVNDLYQRAYRTEIPQDVSEDLLTDPLLSKTFSQVKNKPEFKRLFDEQDEGSLGKWDLVKRQLDGRIAKEKNTAIKTSLRQAKAELVETLDDLSPVYRQARKVSQRGIAKQNILRSLEKVREKSVSIDPERTVFGASVDQFFDSVLSTPEKRAKLLSDLGNSKLAKRQIDDLSSILKTMRGSTLKGLLKTEDNVRIRTGGFGFKGLLAVNATALLRGKYNKEMAEFITNPRWAGALKNVNKIKDKGEKVEAIGAVMARISATLLEEEDQFRQLGGPPSGFQLNQL